MVREPQVQALGDVVSSSPVVRALACDIRKGDYMRHALAVLGTQVCMNLTGRRRPLVWIVSVI